MSGASYTVFDAALSHRVNRNLNVTGARAQPDRQGLRRQRQPDDVLPGAPRSFELSLQARFSPPLAPPCRDAMRAPHRARSSARPAGPPLSTRAKRWLYLIHRWAGVVLCLFFAMWFVSGVVMMYVGYPKLTPFTNA